MNGVFDRKFLTVPLIRVGELMEEGYSFSDAVAIMDDELAFLVATRPFTAENCTIENWKARLSTPSFVGRHRQGKSIKAQKGRTTKESKEAR